VVVAMTVSRAANGNFFRGSRSRFAVPNAAGRYPAPMMMSPLVALAMGVATAMCGGAASECASSARATSRKSRHSRF